MNYENIGGNNVKSLQPCFDDCNIVLKYQVAARRLLLAAGIDKYTPQSSFSLPGIAKFHTHLRNQVSDAAFSKIEGLIALYGALSSTQDVQGFSCVLILYAKTHGQQSLAGKLREITTSLFEGYTAQSSNERPKWLDDMTKGLYNWKLLINSPSFSKVSRVMSLLVTLGCIERQSVSLGKFELFAFEAQSRQANAIDLMDAVCETVVYFAEGAYQCFISGSLKPLLFSTSEVIEMEEAYVTMITQWEYARNGNLKKYTDTSEAEFDKKLTDLVEKLGELYKTMPSGVEKKIIQQKWEALAKIRAEWVAVRIAGGLRASPFCTKIAGDSGVGKSTLSDIIMATILQASGVPCTSEYIITMNEADKYDSNYRSFITGIKIDDFGNAKSQFWEKAPSDDIIKIVNNVREYAVMADLANKGKITIEPKSLVITTNIEDLHAGVTSNNPMSVLRRCHHHIEVKVRPEFMTNKMLDSSKVIEKFGNLDQINDIWLLTMKTPVSAGPSGSQSQQFGAWSIIHKDLSIFEYLNILISDVKKHVHHQDCIVNSFEEPSKLIKICPKCNQLEQTCKCTYEPHFGTRIAQHLTEKYKITKMNTDIVRLHAETKIEDFTVKALIEASKWFAESPYSYWTSWIPQDWIDNEYVRLGLIFAGDDYIQQSLKSYFWKFAFQTFILTWFAYLFSTNAAIFFCVFSCIYYMLCYSSVVRAKQNAYLDEIATRRESLTEAFKSARDKHVQYACGLFAGLAVIYGVVQVVKALKSTLSMQGSLNPQTPEDYAKRDAQETIWKQPEPVATNGTGFSTTPEASKGISKSTALMTCGKQFTGCYMLSTSCVIIPHHFLPEEPTQATIKYAKREFSFTLNKNYVSRIGQGDCVMVTVPQTGPLRDRIDLFAEEPMQKPILSTMYGRDAQNEFFETRLIWSRAATPIHNGHVAFYGSEYELQDRNTFPGMCMSPIVSENRRRSILGVHIGGIDGTPRGCGIELLRSDLYAARQRLQQKNPFTLFGPEDVPLPKTQAGRAIITTTEICPKCPTHYLEGPRNIEVFGRHRDKATARSSVIQTPISDSVHKHTGVPNSWGPPKFISPFTTKEGITYNASWKPWYDSLKHSSNPSGGFDPAGVEWAVSDYKKGLFRVLNNNEKFWKSDIKPLTRLQAVNGIPGKRFIDKMKASTSMGFPICRSKNNFLVEIELEDGSLGVTFTDEVWKMVDDLELACDRNEALPAIFNASLKDEPRPVEKDGARVFQGAPIHLSISYRIYFLPIARFLSMNPLISECAVGINCYGPEWQELAQHMSKFGKDRIIAGDFSKYDVNMPEQLSLAANSIFIDIARWTGNYSEVDLNRMRVLAHAVCSPLVNFNGTIMRLNGTNPSGHNLTVYTNSVVNSLIHRLAFDDAYPASERQKIAKELGITELELMHLCALATLGDDSRGSVMEGYDKFNHVQIGEFLAKHHIKYTMPDKTSEAVEFMNNDEADFLKRKCVYMPQIQHIVGVLDESSIFKSLHSIVESKEETPLAVSTMNIGGAMREWFFHGKDTYEKRRTQMKAVAAEHHLPVPELSLSFEDKVEEWCKKYDYTPQSGTVESDEDTDIVDLITADHPMFSVHPNPSQKVVNQVNMYAHHTIEELRNIHIISMINMLDVDATAKRRANTRNTQRALRVLILWKENNDLTSWTYEMEYNIESPPAPVDTEEELCDRVKSILGKPSLEEYPVLMGFAGKGDLVYISNFTILVIEVKRVVGRALHFAEYVRYQAMRYADAFRVTTPEHYCIYAMTYTEYGFEIVDVHRTPKFPRKFARILDEARIHY